MSAKPKFVSPQNFDTVPISPPFFFEGVTTRVLPLRAEVSALQHLIDRYANFVPPQVGRFRVALPYVYLMIIDYGKLALEAANVGWLAQKEFMFAIPTNQYTLCGSKWVFQGVKWFSPYIFVDSDISLMLGRRMYGWKKLRIYEKPMTSSWMDSPNAPIHNVVLLADVFGSIYAGHEQAPRVLCQILQLRDRSFDFPFDPDASLRPWTLVRDAAAIGVGASNDFIGTLSAMRSTPARPDVFFAMAMNLLGALSPANPDASFDVINLKQFRAADRPEAYCYQALTAAPLRTIGVNRAGPLGDHSAGFSASRGLRVQIMRWPVFPIVDDLGLKVSRVWQSDDVEVAEIEPQFPFWYDVNMSYERGRNLAERSIDGVWHVPGGTYSKPGEPTTLGDELTENQRFNTTMGTASQSFSGPFESISATLRVLPLLANNHKLQTFIEAYLNAPLKSTGLSFELWAPKSSPKGCSAYVYLVIGGGRDLYSQTDDIGDWSGQEVVFYVPVRCYNEKPGEKRELFDVGLIPVVTYCSSTAASISQTEIDGIPTHVAKFVPPPNLWPENPTESHDTSLLEVVAETVPTMGRGQQAVERIILEVLDRHQKDDEDLRERLLADWGPALRNEVLRKIQPGCFLSDPWGPPLENARALGLNVLTGKVPVNIYTLKQFHDIANTKLACYQALIALPRTIDRVYQMDRLPSTLRLLIQEYQSHPIVSLLGLEATLTVSADGVHRYALIPVSPFWARVQLSMGLGRRLFNRSTSTHWSKNAKNLGKMKGLVTHEMLNIARDMDMGTPPPSPPHARGDAGGEHPTRGLAPTLLFPSRHDCGFKWPASLKELVEEQAQRLREYANHAIREKIGTIAYLMTALIGQGLIDNLENLEPIEEYNLCPDKALFVIDPDTYADAASAWAAAVKQALLDLPSGQWRGNSIIKLGSVPEDPDVKLFVAAIHDYAVEAVVREFLHSSEFPLRSRVKDKMPGMLELAAAVFVSFGGGRPGIYRVDDALRRTSKQFRSIARQCVEDLKKDESSREPQRPKDGAKIWIRFFAEAEKACGGEPLKLIENLEAEIADALTNYETKRVVECYHPQMVIESMLAYEWYSEDPDAPRKRRRAKLAKALDDKQFTSVKDPAETAYDFCLHEYAQASGPSDTHGLEWRLKHALDRFRVICELCLHIRAFQPHQDPDEFLWKFYSPDCKLEHASEPKSDDPDPFDAEYMPDEKIAVGYLRKMFSALSHRLERLEHEKLVSPGFLEQRWFKAMVRDLRKAYEAQFAVVMNLLASLGRTPEFFVDLSIFDSDNVSRYFPPEQCWHHKYVGPKDRND
jgi:hypothetical protein